MHTSEVSESDDGLATRSRGKLLALLVATMLAVYLGWRLIASFLPAIVLAFTLAIITHRPMEWLRRRWQYPQLTAGLGILGVAIAFLLPVGGLIYFAVVEVGQTVDTWRAGDVQSQWQQLLAKSPRLQQLWTELSQSLQLEQAIPRALEQTQRGIATVIGAAAYIGTQGLLALFFLFFLYRDEQAALHAARRLMPLNDRETNDLFQRLDDTVHATIFGTVFVAMIQGVLGGRDLCRLGDTRRGALGSRDGRTIDHSLLRCLCRMGTSLCNPYDTGRDGKSHRAGCIWANCHWSDR